jgi:hypothetical protein
MAQAGRCCMTLFCAWILWSHVWGAKPAHQNHPWRTEGAFEARRECEREKSQRIEWHKDLQKRGADWGMEFLCLPDTVKPQ